MNISLISIKDAPACVNDKNPFTPIVLGKKIAITFIQTGKATIGYETPPIIKAGIENTVNSMIVSSLFLKIFIKDCPKKVIDKTTGIKNTITSNKLPLCGIVNI